jgi:hypothetical protein
MTALAQALQLAASEQIDIATVRDDVMCDRRRLDLAGSQAQLAKRLRSQLMSTTLAVLRVAIPKVRIAVPKVCCHR